MKDLEERLFDTEKIVERLHNRYEELQKRIKWLENENISITRTLEQPHRDLEGHIQYLDKKVDGISKHTQKRVKEMEKQLADMTRKGDTLTVAMTLVSGDTVTVQFSDWHTLEMTRKEYEAIIAEGKAQGEATLKPKLDVKEEGNDD